MLEMLCDPLVCVRPARVSVIRLASWKTTKGRKKKKKQRKQRKANTSSEKKKLLFSLSNNFRKRTYAFFPLDSVKEKGEKMVQRADGANKHAVETTVSLVVTQKKVFIPDSQCIFPEIKCEK